MTNIEKYSINPLMRAFTELKALDIDISSVQNIKNSNI